RSPPPVEVKKGSLLPAIPVRRGLLVTHRLIAEAAIRLGLKLHGLGRGVSRGRGEPLGIPVVHAGGGVPPIVVVGQGGTTPRVPVVTGRTGGTAAIGIKRGHTAVTPPARDTEAIVPVEYPRGLAFHTPRPPRF